MFFDVSHLRQFGAAPCLIWRNRPISYDELAERAEMFARRLPTARGLIAIEMASDPVAISAYLGALSAGHAVMPLPEGEQELADLMERRFRPSASWRRQGGAWRLRVLSDPAALHPDLALLLQTSGSTGQGRGVRLSASALDANARAIVDYLRLGARDRAALILPLHYSYGLSVLHSHLAVGASLWLAEESVLAPGFGAALDRSGATSLAGVPHHLRMLESTGIADALPASLDCLTVAGGATEPAAVCRWAARMEARGGRFVVMYGQTEATARIAYLPPDLAAEHPDAIGRAIPGGTLLLRDETGGELTEPQAEGELIYRGPNVMMGYADGAEDLARAADVTELATGDLARRDADGLFRITGRLSRMSKIAGLRIGHDALERALAAAGHETAVWGDDESIHIAACGETPGLARLAAHLAGIGAQHVTVFACDSFPRRANGKIDYPALRRLEPAQIEHDGVLPLFRQVFAGQPVARTDTFAGLGGDSLRHVELSLALDRKLGGLPAGWERQSIEQLQQLRPAGSRIATPILARALAILAVVVTHQTQWPLYGGAAAMVILLGMSVMEFRRGVLIDGNVAQFLAPVIRVLIPYGLVLAGFALAWGQVPWASLLMVSNFGMTSPPTHQMLPFLYWFIEAYVQITLLLLLLFRPRLMRDALAAHPFRVALGLLALAMLMRVTIPEIWPMNGRAQFTVPWVFYLFAFGWCIASAETMRQKALVLALAAICLPMAAWLGGNWYGAWIKYLGLLVLIALLIYVPQVPLPRPAIRVAMYLAQAAFPIYLLHRVVPNALMPMVGLHLPPAATDLVAILGGVGLGLIAAALLRRVGRIDWPHLLSTQTPDEVAAPR